MSDEWTFVIRAPAGEAVELAVELTDVRLSFAGGEGRISVREVQAAERLEAMTRGLPTLAKLTLETPAGFDRSALAWAQLRATEVLHR